MKKFNKSFVANQTKVLIEGQEIWRMVTEINDTRVNIKVSGLVGSFQRGHVEKFTNK